MKAISVEMKEGLYLDHHTNAMFTLEVGKIHKIIAFKTTGVNSQGEIVEIYTEFTDRDRMLRLVVLLHNSDFIGEL